MLRTEIHRQINEIDATLWNNHIDPIHFYHSHEFLSCLQEAEVENADFWFVLIYNDDLLVCTTVLSSFAVNLDLMIGSHWISRLVRFTKTNLFKVKILFCGTPVSIGHKNIFSIEGFQTISINLVVEIMEKLATEHRVRHFVFKEFPTAEAKNNFSTFNMLGYFEAYSLPYVRMDIIWPDYKCYLNCLRSGYRRQIIQSSKKSKNDNYTIKVMSSNAFKAQTFYHWYESVMERAAVKLEKLNEAFFVQLFIKMEDKIKLLVFCKNGQAQSGFLCVSCGDQLYFVWAGKQQRKDNETDEYFNLMSAMVEYAVENNYKIIHFGQTAYYTKMRMGGRAEYLKLFYKARNKYIHFLLHKLSDVIFPKLKLPELHVMKNN